MGNFEGFIMPSDIEKEGAKDSFAGYDMTPAPTAMSLNKPEEERAREPQQTASMVEGFLGHRFNGEPLRMSPEAEKAYEKTPTAAEFGEGALQLSTGMLATVVGGWEGLRLLTKQAAGFDPNVDYTRRVEDTIRGLTYEPRTDGGKEVAGIMAWPFEKLDQLGHYLGDVVFDATKSPTLATYVYTGTVMLAPKVLTDVSLATGKKVYSTGKDVVDIANMAVNKNARNAFMQKTVGKILKDEVGLSSKVEANIARAEEIQNTVPDLQFSLAEITKDPMAIVREQRLVTKPLKTDQGLTAFEIAKRQRELNIEALNDFARNEFSGAESSLREIFFQAKGSVSAAQKGLILRMDSLESLRQTLAKKVSGANMEKVGETLRKIEQEEYLAAKAFGNLLYDQIGDVKVNPAPVIKEVNGLFKNELLDFAQDQIPSSLKLINRVFNLESPTSATPPLSFKQKALMQQKTGSPISSQGQKIQEPVTEISFSTLRSLEKRLKRDLAKEDGSFKPDPETKRIIGKVLQAVDQVKENIKLTADKPIVDALETANTFWREGVADRFYKGAAKDVTQKTAFNEFRIVNEKVLDSFFAKTGTSKGGVKAVDDFLNTYGMNPEAWAQLEIGIRQKFADFTGASKTGIIDPKKAKVFLEGYKNVLDRIPHIKKNLEGVSNANSALSELQQVTRGKETRIQVSELAKATENSTPYTLVKDNFGNFEASRALKIAAKKRGRLAEEGLSKSYGEELLNRSQRGGKVDSKKMLENLNKYEKSLRMVMTEHHFNSLKVIYEAFDRIDSVQIPKRPSDSKYGLSALTEQIGAEPTTVMALWRAKSQGRVGGHHVVAQLGGLFINALTKRQINALETAAHFDPKIAASLMEMAEKGRITPKLESMFKLHLYQLGLASGSKNADVYNEVKD